MKFSVMLQNEMIILRAMQAGIQPGLRVHVPPIQITMSERFVGLSYQELKAIAPGTLELTEDGQLLHIGKSVPTEPIPLAEAMNL
jgi:hypothetical protein